MRKTLLVALLAFSTAPATAGVVILQGTFGPATDFYVPPDEPVPPGPPMEFYMAFESPPQLPPTYPPYSYQLKITDFMFGPLTDPLEDDASITSYWESGKLFYTVQTQTSFASGEHVSVDFRTDGVDFTTDPTSYFGIYVTGSFFEHEYIYRDPVAELIQIDPGFAAPVPEPSAWTLMIGGFALAAAALRRSHRFSLA